MKQLPRPENILKELSSTTAKMNLTLLLDDISYYLTKRQMEILEWKLKNYKNIEIALKVGVCPATVTNEFKRIQRALAEYFTE